MINTGMSASRMVEALGEWAEDNGLTPSPALSPTMSAADYATSVNGMLGTDVATTDSATAMVDKVNAAVDGHAPSAALRPFTFLHVSDTHGEADSVTKAKSLMANDSDIVCLIHTGDIGAGTDYQSLRDALTAAKPKLLAIQGNHDAYDTYLWNYFSAREAFEGWLSGEGSAQVNFGPMTETVDGVAKAIGVFWYKDFPLYDGEGTVSSSRLRIIGTDEFNYTNGTNSGRDSVVSQDQVDWFRSVLVGSQSLGIDGLTKDDYFIVLFHIPHMDRVATPVGTRRVNPFCSSRTHTWESGCTKDTRIDTIVKNYVNKSGDFANVETAKFLFYLAGHIHGDNISYCNNTDDLLTLTIDCTKKAHSGGYSSDIRLEDGDDKSPRDQSVNIAGVVLNKVTVNFADGKIEVERIGQNVAWPHTVGSTSLDTNDSKKGYTYDYGGTNAQGVFEYAPVFVKGGGYWDGTSYHATNDDGSVNDDVDYVKGTVANNVFTVSHILTYTYANGQVVETVTDANGNVISGYTVDRSEFRLRRKKISFPLRRTT